jgi:microcompartment protein CcmK/EutM
MQRAKVIGHVTATAKHSSMRGFRLLVAQVVDVDGRPDGEPLLVVDTLGAAVGSTALITSDGRAARQLVGSDNTPVRYTTFGIEDPVPQRG